MNNRKGGKATKRALLLGCNDNNFNVNANYNIDNDRPARGNGLSLLQGNLIFNKPAPLVKTYKNLWNSLCNFDNLCFAYEKAKRHKSANPAVIEFDKHWQLHLCSLYHELKTKAYKPQPLKKFVLRDPKTRIICVSNFRDRVVHHALVNILQPIFEPRFIADSYASRKGKGALAALKRFDKFKRKVTRNGRRLLHARNANAVEGFVLKADIKHYFQTVDHGVLMSIISKRIKDENILWLVNIILNNYHSGTPRKGMPLGNWTSQFFANVYLNELDQFIKHQLKIKQYIRYVDDFIILHQSSHKLKELKQEIDIFLRQKLLLELHPQKSRIRPLRQGISFLGFRCFYHYRLLRKRNVRKMLQRMERLRISLQNCEIEAHDFLESFQGWNACAMHANTYELRRRVMNKILAIIYH